MPLLRECLSRLEGVPLHSLKDGDHVFFFPSLSSSCKNTQIHYHLLSDDITQAKGMVTGAVKGLGPSLDSSFLRKATRCGLTPYS